MKKYGFDYYEWQEDIIDPNVLGEDELTFSVLKSIVNHKSSKVFTDGRNVIICYSCSPFPVWVWVGPEVSPEQLHSVAECLVEEFPAAEGYTFNLSYELLEKLKTVNTVLENLTVKINMLTYRCDNVRKPDKYCDGKARLAADGEVELLSHWIQEGAYEIEQLEPTLEECRRRAEEKIAAGELFVWENGNGELVAMAIEDDEERYSKVTSVYTLPAERRKGYGLHLVHRITEEIRKKGNVPILYTDADYPASNECYKKIGYVQVGSLCKVWQQ